MADEYIEIVRGGSTPPTQPPPGEPGGETNVWYVMPMQITYNNSSVEDQCSFVDSSKALNGGAIFEGYYSDGAGHPIGTAYNIYVKYKGVYYPVTIYGTESSISVELTSITPEYISYLNEIKDRATGDRYPLYDSRISGIDSTPTANSTNLVTSGGVAAAIPSTYAGSPSAGGPAFKALGIPYGAVDSDSTATVIKATVDNFPATLVDGVCAYIRNDIVSSASGWTLNINGTGALPVYASNADATRVTTIFSAASTYLFVYNSTRVAGGCWDIYYGYNANDNTVGYMLRTNGITAVAAAKFYRYRLLFTSPDGQSLVPANTSTSTNATAARTVNQAKIDPFGPIWYYSTTTAIEANAGVGASYLWMQYSAISLGYSFNRTGAALTMTARYPVYLKCAPQSDGSAIMDADTPIVQALPSTEDGKIYIFLGYAESAVNITLYYHHPVYYFKDGAIRLWTNAAAASITVDQTYDGTSANAQSGVAMAGALAGKQDTIDAQHKLDYGLLSNTPTIPAAQVNSDWNAGSGVAQILNKPTIPPNKTLVLTDIPEDGIGCYWLDPDWTYCSWDELGDAFDGKYEAIYIHTEAYYDEDAQEYRKERYITAPIRLSSDYYEVGSDYIEFDIRGELTPDIFTCCIELGPNGYIQVSYRRAVPPLSTNIVQDKTSNIKTATPKAVADYVDGICGDIQTLLSAI